MKISVVQMDCDPGNIKSNMEKISFYSYKAREKGSDIVVFPEMVDTGYNMDIIRKNACAWDESDDNCPFSIIKKAALDNKINIICNISEKVNKKIYNTTLVSGLNGNLIGKYRKNHLADFSPLNEGSCITPGRDLVVVEINNIKFGLLTCYDLRFPEMSRALVLRGADILVLCSAWPFPRLVHLKTLIRARAIENQVFFISANRTGTDNSVDFCGSSTIADPYGVTLSSACDNGEAHIFSEIDINIIKKIRYDLPVFDHRTKLDKQPLI